MTASLVEMQGITKVYPGGKVANSNVNFDLRQGEIHAIVGENGAGKSTLMKILYGLETPTSGRILVRGKQVRIDDPGIALKLGIGMVHQNFMLVPSFTVAQNIVFGAEPSRGPFKHVASDECISIAKQLSAEYSLAVEPERIIDDVPVGMKQRTEILKMLYRGADILILDEPTQVLAPQEVDELLDGLKRLVRQGKTIVLITHKLREVKACADRITVMRNGTVVGRCKADDVTEDELSQMMVGRDVDLSVMREDVEQGPPVISVRNIGLMSDTGRALLQDVSFDVRSGEIFGLVGVQGNGQSELVEVVAGLRPFASGSIRVNGTPLKGGDPWECRRLGIAHIPEDRISMGVALEASILDNLISNRYHQKPVRKGVLVDHDQATAIATHMAREYDIRLTSLHEPASSLSGGNMQKMIVAREMESDHVLLIAAQPTRGVDVGASEFIYNMLLEERRRGKAVLLVSTEVSEVMALSDRIGVMYNGRIVAILDNSPDLTIEELGLYMLGLKSGEPCVEYEAGLGTDVQ